MKITGVVLEGQSVLVTLESATGVIQVAVPAAELDEAKSKDEMVEVVRRYVRAFVAPPGAPAPLGVRVLRGEVVEL